MALQTKEFIGTTSSSDRWTFKTVVTENSIDEDNETSSITIENFLGRPSNQTSSFFSGNLKVIYEIEGQEPYDEDKYIASDTIYPGGWYSIGSHTFTVPNTGATLAISGSMSTSNFNPNSASAEGKITLTEILGKIRVRINNSWKKAVAYIGVSGTWKKCKVYIGKNNTWKPGK